MYYAEHNRYGKDTTTTIHRDGKEIIVSAGNLHRFQTKALRDAWVAGGDRRMALTAAEARKYHATGDLRTAVWSAHYWGDAPEHFVEPAVW